MNTIGHIESRQVRIDGTYSVGSHKAPDEKGPKAPGADEKAAGADSAGSLEVISSQERLIAAAAAVEDVNVQAVEEARTLIASGQLDTPEAARRAAQAIVDLGL